MHPRRPRTAVAAAVLPAWLAAAPAQNDLDAAPGAGSGFDHRDARVRAGPEAPPAALLAAGRECRRRLLERR